MNVLISISYSKIDTNPYINSIMCRILLLFHGTVHTIDKDSILMKLGGFTPTLKTLSNIVTIDIRSDTEPTHVIDLKKPIDYDIGKYDIITAEYPPFNVYSCEQFFQNVKSLLRPGGVFAFWPGLLTKSVNPLSVYSNRFRPASEYKEMKARTALAVSIVHKYGFTRFEKKNKLLLLY